ncbi:di-heme oxidoredictase family protein [Anthocerotibacter panamensis]|uniref:di-heme oxidoredictase family protein n=1 Tax=Anthocerotibacter panamensis TaxID=2857077 RepID=UPI001C405888|nr:di-heme oxidoredictase family protein [Anthocerotibacter panamensis]
MLRPKNSPLRTSLRIALLIPVTGLALLLSAASYPPELSQQAELGRSLFQRTFKVAEGFGYRLGNSALVLSDRQLGPDAKSCLECHNQGGFGGAAGNRKNVWVGIDAALERRVERANIRNSTALWGVGAVQALAQEMTAELQQQRMQALEQAQQANQPVTVALVSKGVAFGSLTATPSGNLDTSRLEGVDGGLVVKPFHSKGTRETIRRFTFEAAWKHHGLEAPELLKRRYPLNGNWEQYDHDGDGVVNEISTAQITALSVFQALLPAPQKIMPEGTVAHAQVEGGQKFFMANCASCHIPSLALDKPEVTIEGAMGQPPLTVELPPPVVTKVHGRILVPLYSDLKRHEMGAGLAEKNGQLSDDKVTGVSPAWFITTKLWGVADSAPYLHDGSAATLPEAIIAHGGEAEEASKAFQMLAARDQEALIAFLKCLKAPRTKEQSNGR